MTKKSLDAFRRTVTVGWPAQQDAAAKAHLIKTAREGNQKTLTEQRSRSGVAPSVTAYANRPGNTNLESVQLPGPIVFHYEYLQEVLKVGLEMLRANSPSVSGAYRDNHTIYVNGTGVQGVPATLKRGDEVFISNPLPYVRKLEIGTTRSGRDFVIQVPDRIYERTAGQLRARYHNVAKIYSNWVVVKVGAVADWAVSPSGRRQAEGRGGSARAVAEWMQRQPAIIIEAL